MATHSSILARESPGQWSLVGYSPWARKASDRTQRLDDSLQVSGAVSLPRWLFG